MFEEQHQSFVSNMMLLVNWRGIPAIESREVREVLSYHIENMKRMDKDSIEFKCALEAAKVLDRQYNTIRTREQHENPEVLWVPNLR